MKGFIEVAYVGDYTGGSKPLCIAIRAITSIRQNNDQAIITLTEIDTKGLNVRVVVTESYQVVLDRIEQAMQ